MPQVNTVSVLAKFSKLGGKNFVSVNAAHSKVRLPYAVSQPESLINDFVFLTIMEDSSVKLPNNASHKRGILTKKMDNNLLLP